MYVHVHTYVYTTSILMCTYNTYLIKHHSHVYIQHVLDKTPLNMCTYLIKCHSTCGGDTCTNACAAPSVILQTEQQHMYIPHTRVVVTFSPQAWGTVCGCTVLLLYTYTYNVSIRVSSHKQSCIITRINIISIRVKIHVYTVVYQQSAPLYFHARIARKWGWEGGQINGGDQFSTRETPPF